jgi:hypothetical protein
MLIKNPIEFQMVMNAKLPLVIKGVTDALLIELQNIIDEEVYSYQSNGSWNGRTGEFKESWDNSVAEMVGDWWESKIDNQSFNFEWNNERDNWNFGNAYKPLESNDDFNEIIDNRQGGSNFGFPALKRPYWGRFLAFCETSIESIFRAECLKQGIPVEYASVFFV